MTEFQKLGIEQHTRSLRRRTELGWTLDLQKEFQEKLAVFSKTEDKAEWEKLNGELLELSNMGCFADTEPQAYYSIGCCWWTDVSEDLGALPSMTVVAGADPYSLPCCPYCGSPLMQGELSKFIAQAYTQVDHYAGSIDNFWKSRGKPCKKSFKEYV